MSKRNDIWQLISKYLNGELDGRAMHQLEKEAQNDPFLMEALEGYEKNGTDQQKNIDELNSRLQSRLLKSERRIIPWRLITIAASVLIVTGIGALFIRNYHADTRPKVIASVDKAKMAPVDTVKPELPKSKLIAANAPKIAVPKVYSKVYEPAASGDNAAAENPPVVAQLSTSLVSPATIIDTNRLADVNVVGYATQRKTNITASVATISPGTVDKKDVSIQRELASKAAGIYINKPNEITGIVKDETGQPLAGVTVKLKGTSIGVQTNSAGRFKLDSVPARATLSLAYIGYIQRDIPLSKRDSLVIAMQPNNQSLSEVVVVRYGTQRQSYQPAHPQNGWNAFNDYLSENAKSPDGKTGVVKLSFMVNADNSLSDFKVIKSLSAKTDSAAIALIKDGPGWIRNYANKPEKVRVKIKFTGK